MTVTEEEADDIMDQIGEAGSLKAIAEILEDLVDRKVAEALKEQENTMHKSWKD